jgi:phosphatidylglycerophosphatase A
MRAVALAVATAGGAGYVPFAPGTWGSAVGLVAFLLTRHWPLAWQLGLVGLVSIVGVWACGEAARHFRREDPGQAVIDEVAGQWLTCVGTAAVTGYLAPLVGFGLFRAFDIAKPWPIRRFESLHGGFGIMADDLAAGVFANIVLQLVGHWLSGFGW